MKQKMRRHLKYYDGSMMDKEFMEAYRLSRKTFYKYKKQLKEEDVRCECGILDREN